MFTYPWQKQHETASPRLSCNLLPETVKLPFNFVHFSLSLSSASTVSCNSILEQLSFISWSLSSSSSNFSCLLNDPLPLSPNLAARSLAKVFFAFFGLSLANENGQDCFFFSEDNCALIMACKSCVNSACSRFYVFSCLASIIIDLFDGTFQHSVKFTSHLQMPKNHFFLLFDKI